MDHIGKRFAEVRVLEDVHFDLKAGEVHILAGENGAGKTTLIKILSGVHTDYEGEIRFRGLPLKMRSPQDAAAKGISVIYQDMSIVPSMNVVDNIFLGKEKAFAGLWMNFRRQKNQASALLKQFGIDVDLSRPLEDFPISVRQMIEIAKALASDSQILIMDEPTSALNDQETARLFRMIADLKRRGCAIVYISHRLEEIFLIGDRITVLRDGKYIGTSAAGDMSRETLIHWMVGRYISQYFPARSQVRGNLRLDVKNFSLPDPGGSKRRVVDDVSFAVREGEILGIAGLQGSGKSELLNGLFGSYGKTAQGRISLDGKPFLIRSPKHSLHQGLVLQTNDRKGTGLVTGMSVVQNISLASLRKFSAGGWLRHHLEETAAAKRIKELGIKTGSFDQEVRTLSGGNQQKVVLSKCLETEPKVLLLDEPTLGIDVGAKQEIYSLMNQWTARTLSLLLVTSELSELMAMSDRIIVMHRGRIAAEFSRDQATQEKITRTSMGERVGP
jgi:ABC-type sugar transport system ATPase subunit